MTEKKKEEKNSKKQHVQKWKVLLFGNKSYSVVRGFFSITGRSKLYSVQIKVLLQPSRMAVN